MNYVKLQEKLNSVTLKLDWILPEPKRVKSIVLVNEKNNAVIKEYSRAGSMANFINIHDHIVDGDSKAIYVFIDGEKVAFKWDIQRFFENHTSFLLKGAERQSRVA
jgi:hypothetical protein